MARAGATWHEGRQAVLAALNSSQEVFRMCQSTPSQRPMGVAGCTCGCCGCGCGQGFRRFFSRKEELECVENYRDQLKKELAGVEERIKESKGK